MYSLHQVLGLYAVGEKLAWAKFVLVKSLVTSMSVTNIKTILLIYVWYSALGLQNITNSDK